MKDLLAGSVDIVRRRLFEVVKPGRQAAIKQAMSEISGVPEQVESRRDFAPAQRTILALHRAGELNEAALLGFAKAHKYEESVAALSAMSGVKIATLDRLIAGDRHDPILIVGKAVGLEWATVRALILLRLGPTRVPSPTDIENRAREFRAPDAFDRGAGGELLADPPIGVIEAVIRRASTVFREARFAEARRYLHRNDGASRFSETADTPRWRPSRSALRPYRVIV